MIHASTRRLIFAALPIYLVVQGPAMPQDAANDPGAVTKEINAYIADGRIDDAAKDLYQKINGASNADQVAKTSVLANNLKTLTASGKPQAVDEIQNVTYGSSINVRVYYMNFPAPADKMNLRNAFFKYTFMKHENGWALTDFTFTTSGVYPPPGWALPNPTK